MPSLTPCCGTSVGALIHDEDGRLLMIERAWHPVGIAPVAGHVRDAHTDPVSALVEETAEEVGLVATGHRMLVRDLWLPNLCASPPAVIPGHLWDLAEVDAAGELSPDPTETRGAAFYTADEQAELARRTLAYAYGDISETEYTADPGLEAVWMELLHTARRLPIHLSQRDLAMVRRVYTTPPHNYWNGERLVPAADVARDRVPA